MQHLGDRSTERERGVENGITARDRNPKEDKEAFKRTIEMWERAGEMAKRMTDDIRRKTRKREMLSDQNTTEESPEHKDNVGKGYMIAGDCRNKKNKRGESEDKEHLKKHSKCAKKWNDASMLS